MLGVAIGLVGRLKNSVSPYAVLGYSPGLVLDFTNEYYRTGGALTTFDSALTATRAGNATMVDSDGLLKWAPHNLQLYSGTIQSGLSFTGATALSSLEFAEDGSTGSHFYRGLGFNGYKAGEKYTLQFSVKQGTGNRYLQVTSGNANVWPNAVLLDPTNGLFISSQPQDIITVDPEDPTYWRVSITRTIGITAGTQFDYRLYDKDLGTITYTGDNASSMLITRFALYRSDLGGMVNNPDRGDSYVPTTSAARYLPRRGHHVYNGSEWVNEGLLVESAAATNLLINSSDFTAWSASNATLANTGAAAPDGSASWRLTDNGTASFHGAYLQNAFTVGAGFTTWSVMCREGTARYVAFAPRNAPKVSTVNVSVIFDLQTGVFTDTGAGPNATYIDGYGSENLGGGWWRIHLKSDLASASYDDIGVFISTDGLYANLSYTGSGDYIDFALAQIEAGSTPSSYIPTTGAPVIRAAEMLVIPSANLPWSSTAVSIAMDGRATGNTLTTARWYSSSTAYITQSIGTTNFSFDQYGAAAPVTGGTFTSGVNVPFNIASRHGSTFINGAVDGVALTANLTPVALPDLSATDLQLGYAFMGTIGSFRIWADDIGDAGLVAATNPSTEPSLLLTFDSAETSFVDLGWRN